MLPEPTVTGVKSAVGKVIQVEQKQMSCGSKVVKETVLLVMIVLEVTKGPLICL
jgi:hypothetical protein